MGGPRMTRQKALVLEIVQGTITHPTADWVYQEARHLIPDISLGTVYRNLNALVTQGLIREMNYTGASSRYDGNVNEHYHFVCLHCQRVLDLFSIPLLHVDRSVVEDMGHQVLAYRLEFYGECVDCRSKAFGRAENITVGE